MSIGPAALHRLGLEPLIEAVAAGGIVVVTPAVEDERAPIWIRTLVELDGDVVTSIDRAHIDARLELEDHFGRVREKVQALAAAVSRLRVYFLAGVGGLCSAGGVGVSFIEGTTLVVDAAAVSLFAGTGVVVVASRRVRDRGLQLLLGAAVRRAIVAGMGTLPLDDLNADAGRRTSLF